MTVFKDEKIWRILTNIWTYFFIIFILFDFFSKNSFDYLTAPFSAVYIAVLGLYVGTKEFDRWYELHDGRHPGELFVMGWTVVIFGIFIFSFFLGDQYKLSPEIIAAYIMVLSVFALTQKSKQLYRKKRK